MIVLINGIVFKLHKLNENTFFSQKCDKKCTAKRDNVINEIEVMMMMTFWIFLMMNLWRLRNTYALKRARFLFDNGVVRRTAQLFYYAPINISGF